MATARCVATILEVASKDKWFVINFSVEGDRSFVIKAQRWHFKREGVIFAAFDGSENLADVDLDVMAIWTQVRDLSFELMTKDIGWILGDQWER